MKTKIKWGVIGSGGIARRRTIPEGIIASENATLVSVYDIDEKANSEVASEFGADACANLEDLFNTDIDAVYVASPANKHLKHVIESAKAKKHVLCEKPLGMSTEEDDQMIETCQKQNVILGSGYMMRYQTQHQEALKMIQEGKLGKCVYGRAQLSCWYPPIEGAWRQSPQTGGGGSLMDMGSHCIDLLEMFFGRVKKLSCFIHNNIHSYESEDSAVVSLFFENGAMATVDAYFCIPDNSSKNILELYGSRGSIIARGTLGQAPAGEMIAYLEGEQSDYDSQQARTNDEGRPINPIPVNMYYSEIKEFSSAILEKRNPKNGYEISIRNQKVIEACYESAKSGKIIEVL
jgi:predicted dehydrogenase